jgi:RNA polymerase sigma-70 factor (ECF subfamily)
MPESSTPSGYASASDETLLTWFRAGDALALKGLLERYELPLFQFLLGVLRDRHQAEDALQETWCKALEHLDDVDWSRLRGWLFTVAYHQAMLSKRRERHRFPTANGKDERVVDPAPGPDAQVAQRDEVRHLHDLIQGLPATQREVIQKRLFEGKRFREIADALDCPLNTALARMHEGVKRLKKLWEPDND